MNIVNMRNDVMIDIETLGNNPSGCLVQVGACYFDRYSGEIKETFKVNIDARSSMRAGGQMDADTVYWWLAQSKEAIDSITAAPLKDIITAMAELNLFLSKANTIWSHATFDFVIISQTFKRLNMKPSFHHTTARDIRTLVDLAGISKVIPRTGTHHDALDDCKYQVLYCVDAFNKVAGNIKNEES